MNSGLSLLPWLAPERINMLLALMIGATGLCLYMIGLKRLGRRMLLGSLAFLFLLPLLGPAVAEVVNWLPGWLFAAVVVAVALYLVRLVLQFFLGRDSVGPLIAMAVSRLARTLFHAPVLLARGARTLSMLIRSPVRWRRGLGMVILLGITALGGSAGYQLLPTAWMVDESSAPRPVSRNGAPETVPATRSGRTTEPRRQHELETGTELYNRVLNSQ